jgi:hypothetical protein
VRDRARRAVEDQAVRGEREHARVGRRGEARGVGRRQRGDDMHRLVGQRLQRAADQPAVVLELGRSRDEHDRRVDRVEPLRPLGRRVPVARADQPHIRRPVRARVLERLGGQVQQQRRREQQVGGAGERRHADVGPDRVHARPHEPLERAEHHRAQRGVAQPPERAARRP